MFRFTIRDVLWLTVVVALALGWWLERQATVRRFGASAALGPPTDQEVIDAWGIENGSQAAVLIASEYEQGNVTILKQKIAAYVDRPAGGLQVEHAKYRCKIECPPAKIDEAILVDRTYTRRSSEVLPIVTLDRR